MSADKPTARLTTEEQRTIRRLERLMETWPDSLVPVIGFGLLIVVKKRADGEIADGPAPLVKPVPTLPKDDET